jgi:hypothetical protein
MTNPFDSRPEAGHKSVDAKDAKRKREDAKERRTSAGEKGRTCKIELSVPVIAAVGGVVFLGEPITLRLLGASVVVLGGIALVIVDQRKVA